MSILDAVLSQGAGGITHILPTVLITILLVGYLTYRRIMPKPLPGIPYHPSALSSPLGDLPILLENARKTGDVTAFLQDQIKGFQSPISQMFFTFPWWKPVVILSDAREAEDILVRRTPKEFDRSTTLATLFEGIVPGHQIMLPTDKEWKAHRRLLQDLMSPGFLRGTASKAIWKKVVDLVELWEVKNSLAGDRAFSAKEDIHYAALDGVMMFSFGDHHITEGPISERLAYLKALSEEEKMKIREDKRGNDDLIEIPEPELDQTTQWILELADSVEAVRKRMFRRLAWKIWRGTWLRKSLELKREFILGQLDQSVKEMDKHADDDESWIRSAVDHIVMREKKYAIKEGRKPDYTSDMILEEVGASLFFIRSDVMGWANR